MAESNHLDPKSPWPGLKAYNEEDAKFFFGRGEEIDQLFRLVQRGVLTVVFGPSGSGKSSLLRAGLFPRVRENGGTPFWIRLKHGGDLIHQVQTELGLSGKTLWEGFHKLSEGGTDPLVVFDQFEEVFTLGDGRVESVTFLEQLADVVENFIPESVREKMEHSGLLDFDNGRPKYQVIIALRKDFVWCLDGLRNRMPSIMRDRFVLEPFMEKEALEAVENAGVEILDHNVAERIVAFAMGPRRTKYVEPSILSLLCRELSKNRSSNGEIMVDQLTGTSETILEKFFEDSIAEVSVDSRETLRAFIENRLVSPNGFRTAWPRKELSNHDVAVEQLIDGRVLRGEERFGSPHLELTHDVLTEVVKRSRDTKLERERLAGEEADRKLREGRIQAELWKANKRRWWTTIAAFVLLLAVLGVAYFAFTLSDSREELRRSFANLDSNRKDLAKTNKSLEDFRKRLLRQSGWPEEKANRAQIDERTLTEVLDANEELQKLDPPNSKLRIYYYGKEVDLKDSLVSYWKSQGYMPTVKGGINDRASNVIWFRGDVPLIDMKRVALSLIRAGAPLHAIVQLSSEGEAKVDINSYPEFDDHLPWTVAEVVSRKEFVSPRPVLDPQKAVYVVVSQITNPAAVTAAFAVDSVPIGREQGNEMVSGLISRERAQRLRLRAEQSGAMVQVRSP